MNLFKQFVSPLLCSSVLFLASGCAVDSASRPLGVNHPASPSAVAAPGMARPILMTNLAAFTSRPVTSDNAEGHKEHGHDHNHMEAK